MKEFKLNAREIRFRWHHFLLLMLVAGGQLWFAWQQSYHEGYYSPEAVIRQAQVVDMFSGDSRGYHGLISSALWSPLLTVSILPFAGAFDWFARPGFTFQIISSLIAGMAAAYFALLLYRIVKIPRIFAFPLSGLAFSLPLIFYLVPNFQGTDLLMPALAPFSGWQGQWPIFITLFGLATTFHYYEFMRNHNVTQLIAASIWCGMLVLTHSMGILLALIFAIWLAPVIWRHGDKKNKGQLSGLLLIFLLPAFYPLLVWMIFNWMVLENPLHLFRDAGLLLESPMSSYKMIIFGLSIISVTLGLGLMARNIQRALMLMAVCAYFLCLLPLGLQNHGLDSYRGKDFQALMCAPGGSGMNRDADEIASYIKTYKTGSLVLFVGYPGYEWISLNQPDFHSIHKIDFDPYRVLDDTKGRDVYFLASRQQAALYSRQVPKLWERMFMSDREFENWALYRFIREDAGIAAHTFGKELQS